MKEEKFIKCSRQIMVAIIIGSLLELASFNCCLSANILIVLFIALFCSMDEITSEYFSLLLGAFISATLYWIFKHINGDRAIVCVFLGVNLIGLAITFYESSKKFNKES